MNLSNFNQAAKCVMSLKVVLIVSLLDITFFGLTTPSSANSVTVIAGALLLGAGTYVWLGLLVRLIAAFYPMALNVQRRVLIFLTLLSLSLVLMQSIGQLSGRDVLTLLPFAIALYAYISYATVRTTQEPR